jgi:hypothetical protein
LSPLVIESVKLSTIFLASACSIEVSSDAFSGSSLSRDFDTSGVLLLTTAFSYKLKQ